MTELGADAVFGVAAGGVLVDVVDDFLGDVAAGDFFDTEARRGIHLEDERTASGAHEVDAGDVEAHGLRGFDGDAAFFSGQFDASSLAAFMEVAAEIVIERLTLHAGDDARANDEGADVDAGRFLDILLEEDVRAVFVIEVEGLKSRLRGFFRLGKDDAVAVGAGSELNDDREADLLEKIVDVGGVAGDEGLRSVDAGLGQNLLRAELVAGADDSDRARGRPDALHLKLTDDGTAVAGHVVRNAGQNRIETGEIFAVIIYARMLLVKREVTVFIFYNSNLMATLLGFLDEAFSGIVGVAVR